jgi:nitrite reductase/ring-hydroxylating ferredoxin subunit
MSDEKRAMERRTFLCVVGAAGVAAGCGGDGGDEMPAAPFSAGRVADHPMGVWKLYKLYGSQRVIVGRDAMGYFAFSANCTHESAPLAFRESTACTAPTGCTAVSMTGATECSLHFSRFDGDGAPVRGPAASPLRHFQVTVASGEITVNAGVVVAATVRSMGA